MGEKQKRRQRKGKNNGGKVGGGSVEGAGNGEAAVPESVTNDKSIMRYVFPNDVIDDFTWHHLISRWLESCDD